MLEAVSAAMKAVHATEKRKATVKGPGRQHKMVQPRTPPAAPVDDLVDLRKEAYAEIPAIPKTSDEFMWQEGQDRERSAQPCPKRVGRMARLHRAFGDQEVVANHLGKAVRRGKSVRAGVEGPGPRRRGSGRVQLSSTNNERVENIVRREAPVCIQHGCHGHTAKRGGNE
ncbi:hypothetical protein HPB51_016020 [Rhipicephalus microplus]|uniref:Uncharacterized protein n=1 Tax=Rhipicephalus microplus TaxID=6941 RepID=A0A9J6DI27_RHIMP|nr:hypothetical protein HPB51_016020 [Rhipicephalus microplus]